MKTVMVALGERAYPIYIGTDVLDQVAELTASIVGKAAYAIVTDSNVGPLYAQRLAAILEKTFGRKPVVAVLPAGEENKRLDRIEYLCGVFLEAGLDRSSVIFALGGGVTGDVAAFAASVFMRGIRCIQIPTTVLAQVDSSVGGKTGVNHPLGKNTIGAFHQPSAVFIDLALLRSLPSRELHAGLAEIVKHGVIADAGLFDYMKREAGRILAKDLDALEWPILRSCEIKSSVVVADEHEHGQRANLNYGHTVGHAIESVTGYGKFLHGEAVSLGMQAAGALAVQLGMIDPDFPRLQGECLAACGLPVCWPELPVDDTLSMMKHDKKVRAGILTFILPDRLGHVVRRSDVTEDKVRTALAFIQQV